MTNLDELFRGIEVEMDATKPIGRVSEQLIDRLDLVYALANGSNTLNHYFGIDLEISKQSVNNVEIVTRKILTSKGNAVKVIVGSCGNDILKSQSVVTRKTNIEDDTLQKLYLFGAVESAFRENVMTPVLCVGEKPEGERVESANLVRYQGLIPVGVSDHGFVIKIDANEWKGAIDVYDDGEKSTYVGGGNHLKSVLFDELIPFGLDRALFYARSPNGSVDLDSLGNVKIKENGEEVEYSLVYANPDALRGDKNFAVNSKSEVGWEKSFMLGFSYLEHLRK